MAKTLYLVLNTYREFATVASAQQLSQYSQKGEIATSARIFSVAEKHRVNVQPCYIKSVQKFNLRHKISVCCEYGS